MKQFTVSLPDRWARRASVAAALAGQSTEAFLSARVVDGLAAWWDAREARQRQEEEEAQPAADQE